MAAGLVQASDVLTRVRTILAESSQNRWTDAYLLTFLSDAQTRVASDLIDNDAPWPTAQGSISGQSGVGRYPLFPCLRVLRVYLQVPNVAAQLLPGTDIPTLEGDNLLIYDSTSDSVQGDPSMTPQWLGARAQNFPLIGRMGQSGPIANTGPWQDPSVDPDSPPQCVIDGGNIIIVPAPLNAAFNILVDHVPLPTDFTQTGDFCMFPQNFRDALAYDVCVRVNLADGRDSQVQIYEAKYGGAYSQNGVAGGELAKLVSWRNGFASNKPKRMAVIPPRRRLEWDV